MSRRSYAGCVARPSPRTILTELLEMGEAYHREKGCFLCPDCWDSFRRMDPEEQVKLALEWGAREGR